MLTINQSDCYKSVRGGNTSDVFTGFHECPRKAGNLDIKILLTKRPNDFHKVTFFQKEEVSMRCCLIAPLQRLFALFVLYGGIFLLSGFAD